MGTMKVSIIPNPELIEFKPQEFVPEANLFTKQSESVAINEAYQKCKDLPNFTEIDNLRTDGLKCAKLYSNPEFFLEEWMNVMNKDIEARKKKREERKKDKVKLKKEKKIRELSKKQYNSDGEVINQKDQERLTEYRKSKASQLDSLLTETITMDATTANPTAATTTSVPPPPPAMTTTSVAPPPPPPPNISAPTPPTMTNIGQIPPPLPSIEVPAAPPPPPPPAANAPPPPPPPPVNAPPPPPPPPGGAPPPPPAGGAPPPPSGGGGAPPPPPPSGGGIPTISANALQSVQLKKASATPAPPPVRDTRDDLLSNIKMGGVSIIIISIIKFIFFYQRIKFFYTIDDMIILLSYPFFPYFLYYKFNN